MASSSSLVEPREQEEQGGRRRRPRAVVVAGAFGFFRECGGGVGDRRSARAIRTGIGEGGAEGGRGGGGRPAEHEFVRAATCLAGPGGVSG